MKPECDICHAPATVQIDNELQRERRGRFWRRGWQDFKTNHYCPRTWDKTLLRDYQAGWRESAVANAAMKAVGVR